MWSALGTVTVMVVWVLMAHAYNQSVGGCLMTPFKHRQKYGGRGALLATGWCILFVVIVFFSVLQVLRLPLVFEAVEWQNHVSQF
ncbi:hypothetical protein TRSC58_02553 [Trypanosoma rangeli SC58]|uniref:Uncharacterized protein n=1 Tax=Trypanosoma rangeli SC58 TaxID=429131 RepID=A0A061J2Q9_TRYRA|nr:hypothetical protein TRSC58_02553 [Trypanosoma rangeli SC58]